MGCMVLNSYLGFNPDIADRVAGVIYSAPLFGIPDFSNFGPVKANLIKLLAMQLEEFALSSSIPLSKITRNKQYF